MNFIVLDFVFSKIFELSAAASAIMIIIMLLNKLGRSLLTPKLVYFLWLVFILKLIFPISIPSFMSIENITDKYLYSEKYSAVNIAIDTISKASIKLESSIKNYNSEGIKKKIKTYKDGKVIEEVSKVTDPGIVEMYKYNAVRSKILSGISVIWLIGFIILTVIKVHNNKKFQKHFMKDNYCEDKQIINLFIDCKKQMRVDKQIKLIMSGNVMPMICGVFNPCIILPYDCLKTFTVDELKFILLHELGHYKQKDIILYFLAEVLSAVYWFNPLIYIGLDKMKDNLELLSDNNVLKEIRVKDSISYGKTLLKQAEINMDKLNKGVFPALLKNSSKFSVRIQNILNYRYIKVSKIKYVIGVVIIVCMILVMIPVNDMYAVQKRYIKQKPILYAFWINNNVDIITEKNINVITSEMIDNTIKNKDIVLIKKDENIDNINSKKIKILFSNEPVEFNIKEIRNEINSRKIKKGRIYVFLQYNFATTKLASMGIEKGTIIDMKTLEKLDKIELY